MKRLKNIQERIPRLIAKNWTEKVICLTLALFLFLFYRISSLETKTFSVPLQIENAELMVPSAPYLKTVRVSLRGERGGIYSVLEEEVLSYIDISAASKEGEIALPVRVRLSGTAASIKPLEISVEPAEVIVVLERRESKAVPVSAVLTGFPAEGYALESCVFNPPSLEVSGPRSLVEGLSDLKTEPISLSGLNSGFDGTTAVIVPEEFVSLLDSNSVSYRLSVSAEISQRRLENVRFTYSSLISGLEIQSAPVSGTLVVSGPVLALSRWTPPSTLLFVSCAGITEPGAYNLEVRANVPQQFSVDLLEPQVVPVVIRRIESEFNADLD